MFPFRNPQSLSAPRARSQSTPCSLDPMSLVVLLRLLISCLRLETGLCDDLECYGILLLIFSSVLKVPVLRGGQGGYRKELKREGELSIIASDEFPSVSGLRWRHRLGIRHVTEASGRKRATGGASSEILLPLSVHTPRAIRLDPCRPTPLLRTHTVRSSDKMFVRRTVAALASAHASSSRMITTAAPLKPIPRPKGKPARTRMCHAPKAALTMTLSS